MPKLLTQTLLAVLSSLAFSLPVYGQEDAVCHSRTSCTSQTVYFRFDRTDIDSAYANNRHALEALHALFTDSFHVSFIDSVHIHAYSSPEGREAYNIRLSMQRAAAMKKHLTDNCPLLSTVPLSLFPGGENWDGLRELVSEDSGFNEREEVLMILNKVKDSAKRERLLKRLNGGRAYKYMQQHILPLLRNAMICTVRMNSRLNATALFASPRQAKPANEMAEATDVLTLIAARKAEADSNASKFSEQEADITAGQTAITDITGITTEHTAATGTIGTTAGQTTITDITGITARHTAATGITTGQAVTTDLFAGLTPAASIPETAYIPITSVSGRYSALKTNLAAWATTSVNLAYEVQIGKRFSLDLPVMWSSWDLARTPALRIALFQPELRYWLSRPGQGHFFGLHVHVARYNLKWEEYRYQDTDYPLWGAGVSYGYALPLTGRWGMEFNFGVGYANSRYDTFHNVPDGALYNTRLLHYWGITRLGLSFIYKLSKP